MTGEYNLLQRPLTRREIIAQRDGDNWISGVVAVELSDAIDNDLEGFLDICSEHLVGDALLMDINYDVVGFAAGNVLHVKVEGDTSMSVTDDDDDE